MQELLDFLHAQLAEDERVARAASVGPWRTQRADSVYADETTVVLMPGPLPEWATLVVPPQCEGGEGIEPADAEHIGRWDPARVLAEVEAKRRVLDVILAYEAKIDGEWGCCHSAKGIEEGRCPETPPGEIHAIRLLAQPYAGREGWREEWSA